MHVCNIRKLFCCFRWSQLLTPGPACLCKAVSKDVRHNLWQNQLWFKRKAAEELHADSDEDDTEQFGIQQAVADGSADALDGPATGQDDEDADAYPLYGQDDDDFADSSSEVCDSFTRLRYHEMSFVMQELI